MKPVAVFRHLPIEGPGYFATFLDNNHIPWRLIKETLIKSKKLVKYLVDPNHCQGAH